MRQDMAPGTNPDFVLAMKYLFDREQMRKTIALDQAVVANDQPIDPTNRFYFAGLPQRPFDPEKAKFHLQEVRPRRHDDPGGRIARGDVLGGDGPGDAADGQAASA